MHAEQRRQLRFDYALTVEGPDGWKYRRGLSKDKALRVYDACVDVRDSGQEFETAAEFREKVAQRLREQGTFGMFGSLMLVFLIVKLVMLFIELWMAFDAKMLRLYEGEREG